MTEARASASFWTPGRLAALLIAAMALLFAAANAHLLVVSFASQPDCVAPASEGAAAYRAAKPSC